MGAQVSVTTHLLNGRRVPQMVDSKTLGNDETIEEAIQYGYVMGKPDQIGSNVKGVMKSMIKGIAKDGDGRKIDAFFSVQPSIRGSVPDITDDFDKSKVKVVAKARPLKELTLDTSGWSVYLEGSTGNLNISGVSTGETSGVITIGENVHINGFGLKTGEGDTVKWNVPGTDRSGTVPESAIESDMTRITIAASAFAELNRAEYNDKLLVLTVKIGNNRAIKNVLIKIA